MKSYQQFCTVARALDVVGDRWVLLIVRELLALGPSRYSDLKAGLPGIASSMLADRLRAMEADGLIERRDAPAPIATGVYQLTERGRGLEDVLRALSRWGQPTMVSAPSADEAAQPQWLALFAALTLPDRLPAGARLRVGIDTGRATVTVTVRHDGFEITRELSDDADVTLHGPALLVGGVLSGVLTIEEAQHLGLTIDGRSALLADLLTTKTTTTGATP
jgi:DNA-binding HxlR family transcriptional regulator